MNKKLSLAKKANIDHIVLVGGYAFSELEAFVNKYFGENSWIEIIYNDKFIECTGGYSLACGVNALKGKDFDEIIFMEGDLIFDTAGFLKVVNSKNNVITANRELIYGNKSVVFYITTDDYIQYVYDPTHRALHIKSAATLIGNSGQVWKFNDPPLLHQAIKDLGCKICDETNLIPINNYMNVKGVNLIDFITFETWFNCNTIEDYKNICQFRKKLKDAR